jgi:hypothetical protein
MATATVTFSKPVVSTVTLDLSPEEAAILQRLTYAWGRCSPVSAATDAKVLNSIHQALVKAQR